MEKKKIGLGGALLMGIGCIIGSGIFGTMPTVANEYGPGIVWALLGAAFVVILRSLSLMYTSSALPTTASQFMWASKLLHPYAGVFVSIVSQQANDIKHPERNVPIALALCPLFVAIVYILMAVATIGVVPYAEVQTLAQVAEHFMSPALLIFFIVGGPICGIITSLVPVALSCVALVEFSARAKVFPAIFAERNKHGTAYWSLVLVMAIAIGICATGATFGVVMTIFSFCNTVAELPNAISPIFAHRKYPKSCDNSPVKMPFSIARVLAVLIFVICVYLSVQMALTLDMTAVVGIFAVYICGFIYFYFRVKYLSKKGVDLIAELREPVAEWEEKERSYQ